MSEAETDEAIEVQEEVADDEEGEEGPAIEVQEPATAETDIGDGTQTIFPFYSTRGGADRTVRVRAGWHFEDGSVHSLPIDNTVPLELAQLAEDLARSWQERQLNIAAQERAAAAEETASTDDG